MTRQPPGDEPASSYLRLVGLRKAYGPLVVVDDVSLDVGRGEFVTLLGPSGSGKTTILMMIAGFTPPNAGRVFLDGPALDQLPPYRRDIGLVFQSFALFPHKTVAQNIAFALKMRRRSRGEIRDRVSHALELVKLPGFEDRLPAQLSGGQQQRVALARAIVFGPRLLLMDEPLGALDRKMREQMQIEIMSLHRELGISVLYVTHDQEEALVMSHRVVVLNEGRVEQKGAPADLYERPATRFVAEFIGETNVLNGTITELSDGLCRVASGELALCGRLAAPAGRGAVVAAVVRPERVKLRRASERAESRRENACRGMVVDVIYLGKSTKHVVRLDDGRMLQALGQNDSGTDRLAVGTPVEAAWDSASLRILPETEERGGMCQRSVR